MLHAHNGGEAFKDIVAGDRHVFVLQQGIVFCVLVDRAGEGSAEAAAVRAAVRIWNGIRVAKELLVVGISIVQTNLDDHLVPRALDHDRLGVHESFVFDQAVDKFFHAEWVNDLHRPRSILALIKECERERSIDVSQIIQAGDDALGFELDCFLENLRIWQEGDERACLLGGFDLGDHMQALLCCASLERHSMDLTIASHFDFEPLGNRVNALRADAVGSARVFVVALAVFSAGVQAGENEFHAGDAFFLVDIDGNAASVVANGNRTIRMNGHIDMGTMACQKFIDRVVKNLAHAMVERTFVGAADVHAGLFTHGLQSLEGT